MLTILKRMSASRDHLRPYRAFELDGIKTIGIVPGEEYAIRFSHRGQRGLVLVSVDGTNVLTGQPAVDSPDEPGFPLEPGRDLTIHNWQEDGRGGGALVFATPDYSVGTYKTDGSALGYISVILYLDAIPYPSSTYYRPHHPSGFIGGEEIMKAPQLIGGLGQHETYRSPSREHGGAPFPGGEPATVGTGVGRRIDNPVGSTKVHLTKPELAGLEQVRYMPIDVLRERLHRHPSGFQPRPMANLSDIPRLGDQPPADEEFVRYGISRFGGAATTL